MEVGVGTCSSKFWLEKDSVSPAAVMFKTHWWWEIFATEIASVFESVDAHHVSAVAWVILQTLPTYVTRKHFGVGVGRNVFLETEVGN